MNEMVASEDEGALGSGLDEGPKASKDGSKSSPEGDSKFVSSAPKEASATRNRDVTEQSVDQPLKAISDRIRGVELLTLVATVVIAGATVWNVFYVRGQLDEMAASANQTKLAIQQIAKLASAADNQAVELHLQVQQASHQTGVLQGEVNVLTKQLAEMVKQTKMTEVLLRESQRQANAALQKVDIDRRAVSVSNRPWLAVGAEVSGPVELTTNASSIPILLKLENVGRSPATNIQIGVTVIYQGISPSREMEADCVVPKASEGYGFVPVIIVHGTDSVYLDYTSTVGFKQFQISRSNSAEVLAPVVVGCVTYESTFDKVIHHTRFAYIIGKKSASKPSFNYLQPVSQTVKKEDIAIGLSGAAKSSMD